jgi:hypothetical protein
VTHEMKFEYKKWGIWFVECECGERFTSTTLATAVEKHEQHSFTRYLQSKVKEDNDVRSEPKPPWPGARAGHAPGPRNARC